MPTAGFLGGTFQGGLNNALCAIAGIAKPRRKSLCVNIIGEKNLEYEVEENYSEIVRLLTLLGIPFERIEANPYRERSTVNLHYQLSTYMGTGQPRPLEKGHDQ